MGAQTYTCLRLTPFLGCNIRHGADQPSSRLILAPYYIYDFKSLSRPHVHVDTAATRRPVDKQPRGRNVLHRASYHDYTCVITPTLLVVHAEHADNGCKLTLCAAHNPPPDLATSAPVNRKGRRTSARSLERAPPPPGTLDVALQAENARPGGWIKLLTTGSFLCNASRS